MVKRISFLALAFIAIIVLWNISTTKAQPTTLPKLVNTVTLPGYTGDFDHFAVDRPRHRVLLAAEDHATLEVFNLETGEHLRTVPGFDAPHSILVRNASATILVTDSGKSMSKLQTPQPMMPRRIFCT
jgi:hypothetical protein